VKPGDVKAIRDEGMPTLKNPYVRGNLYIDFQIQFPDTLSAEARKVLRKNLPTRSKDDEDFKPSPTAKSTVEGKDEAETGAVEEVRLEDVDMEAEKAKFQEQSREAYEEDDEHGGRGGGHGHGQPGCRTQ